jgi:hypothetical protein
MLTEPPQEIFSRQACPEQSRRDAKRAKKSPFHPPFEKGERGGFDETWKALHAHSLAGGRLARVISFPILQANIQPRT